MSEITHFQYNESGIYPKFSLLYPCYSFLIPYLLTFIQGGVAHTYIVGRSSTAVKLKVNGQFEIFSKVNGQATTFL